MNRIQTHYKPDRSKATWCQDIRNLEKPPAPLPQQALWESEGSGRSTTKKSELRTFALFGVILLFLGIGCVVAIG